MPTTATADAALAVLASLVLEDGRRWGEAAVEGQWADARAVLDPTSGQPYHFLTRARGYSKTGDLAGMAIAAMLAQLPDGARLFALASDRDQGRLLVDSIAGFVQRTPGLKGALDVGAYRVTATRSASVLEVIAADAPGAYGLRPAFLIVDEIAQWASTPGPRNLWEATTSALAKVPGARLAVLTSAGDPAHWSAKVLAHARTDPLWHVHEIPGPPPWADPARLAEQRRRLPASSYARLFLNQWTASEDRLVDPDDLRACVVLDGPQDYRPGVTYRIGLDVGLRHDRTVIAVCHAESVTERHPPANRVVLDRMVVLAGTKDHEVALSAVEEALMACGEAYGRPKIITDPWQSIGLAQRLRSRGVTVEEYAFTAQSVGRLAVTLHTLLRDRLMALPDDTELLEELARVRLRETSPGVLRMDHDASGHDDRAIALALAASDLVSVPTGPAWTNARQLAESGHRWSPHGRDADTANALSAAAGVPVTAPTRTGSAPWAPGWSRRH